MTDPPRPPPAPESDPDAEGALAVAQAEVDLVRFFERLSADARHELDTLADADRRFGEDVAAERAAGPRPGGGGRLGSGS